MKSIRIILWIMGAIASAGVLHAATEEECFKLYPKDVELYRKCLGPTVVSKVYYEEPGYYAGPSVGIGFGPFGIGFGSYGYGPGRYYRHRWH